MEKKEVKCNFKNVCENDKKIFQESACLLLVSVGQEAHEGERFEATIKLINDSFKSCTISLYDSLQRFTMALSSLHEPADLYMTASKEGDLWLERNQRYIDMLDNLNRIYRWDQWLNHPLFQQKRDELVKLINTNSAYKDSYDNAVNGYLDRYCKNIQNDKNFDKGRATNLCYEYVIEECAVLCLWPEINCQFEIYPNTHNTAIEATRSRFIIPNYANNLHPLTLRFRNAKQLKPQKFVTINDKE